MIGRNVIANVLGGSWNVFLGLLIVPFQIRILGVEAYGLLAFLASLQAVFNLFDLGLSPTITREVASDSSPDFRHSRELIQEVSTAYWSVGVILGLALALNATWLATHWLKLDTLSVDSATLAIQLGALVVAVRWPVTFYAGTIAGRQRFDILNLLASSVVTVGLLGGVVVIILTSSLTTFLAWRAATAVVEVILHGVACFRLLPGFTLLPRFSVQATKQVWRFAVTTNLIGVFGLIATQSDRFLISKLLPLQALGYYSLAYSTASILVLIYGMITSAMFPVFASDYGQGELDVVAVRCAKAAQVISYCVALPAFLLIFFGHDLLQFWIDPGTAQASSKVMAVLAFGFLISAPLNICSTLAIATGHPRLPLLVNVAGFFLYVPCLYVLTTRFSLYGAALTWVLLQLYYVITFAPLALRLLGRLSVTGWFGRNVLPFVLIGAAALGSARIAASMIGGGIIVRVVLCGLMGVAYAAVSFLALHPELKAYVRCSTARSYLAFKRVLRQGRIRAG